MITRRKFVSVATASAAAMAVPAFAQVHASGPIRIGQIGSAHAHATGKMEAVRSLPELYEVVGVSEANEKRRSAAKAAQVFADLQWKNESELLQTPGLQAVVIETTLEESTPAALRAVQAGKHVHLDKPGGADHLQFAAMREAATKRGVTVQMGYMLRYNPAFELLFRAAKKGWLGEITEIDASMGKLAPDGVRDALRVHPGFGMFELACHLVDAVVTIMGKPQAVHAFAKSTRGPDDRLSDNQLAVLEYSKATAVLRCNHADPFGSPRRKFFVAGTKGAMEIEPLESGKATLYLSEAQEGYAKGMQTIALRPPANRYADEFRDFARVIRGEKKVVWSAEHDIAVHETALRAAGAWSK